MRYGNVLYHCSVDKFVPIKNIIIKHTRIATTVNLDVYVTIIRSISILPVTGMHSTPPRSSSMYTISIHTVRLSFHFIRTVNDNV